MNSTGLAPDGRKGRKCACFVLISACVLSAGCHKITTFLIVRHADRRGSDDALTPAGVARAQELVHVAEKGDVAAIYHSNTARTRETARPLAEALGLTAVEYPVGSEAGLVADIFHDHRGETVVVVGHSNTVPQIIAAAGGPSITDISDNEFDNLFVLDVYRAAFRKKKVAKMVNLQYGAVSP